MRNNILRKLIAIACLLFSSQSFAISYGPYIDYDFKVNGICYKVKTNKESPEAFVTYNDYGYYSIYASSITYNCHNKYSGNIVVPETVVYGGTSYSVTGIGSYAFYNCSDLKSVTIGNSVTSIGSYAFCDCTGLVSVTIDSSVTSINIGEHAFDDCSIKKAIWLTNTPPKGYTGLPSKIHYVANDQYTSLKNVTIYPYLSSMFEVDGIKYVPVSPSERTCDAIDCAYDSTAVNINIGNTVSYKGVSMTVKEIKPYTCYSNPYIKDVNIDLNGDIPEYAFYNCTYISNILCKTKEIGMYAFGKCTHLKSLTVNVDSIKDYAFLGCATVLKATFDIKAEKIGNYTFSDCSKVESITLSDGLKSIGNNAFENCSNFKEIVIPNAVTSLGEYAFSECSTLENVTIGTSVTAINESTFSGCSKLPEITIPSNVVSVGNDVFNNCTTLATVVINDRDTELSLGSNGSNPLFYSCPLDSVYIGGDISYPTSSSKGYSPFYRNTKLRSVVISDKETEISENEFYGCSNLKNISMGDGVEKIGNWAFSGCSSLEHFAFGSGMKTIGEEAFSDCTAMTKLISRTKTPPTCGTQALDDINKWTCELFVPQSAVSAYQGAEQWKEFFFITGTESSGVKETLIDENEESAEYYNLQGVKVENPSNGIYIKRQGNKTTKVVM